MNVLDYKRDPRNPLRLVGEGDPVLRRRASELFTSVAERENARRLCRDMRAVMRQANGIALCAPQVGLPYSIIVTEYEDKSVQWNINMMNLRVFYGCTARKIKAVEGCLSIPGYQPIVERDAEIGYTYYDLKTSRYVEGIAEGLFARVLQHEWDHLQGKLLR